MIGTLFIKIFPRYFRLILLLLSSITLIATPFVFGQTRKTNRTSAAKSKTVQQTKQSTNKTVNLPGWRTVQIGKWGIESLTLPDGLMEKPETVERHKNNGKITSTYYSQSWEIKPEGELLPSFEVKIWSADNFDIPLRITPELKLSFVHRDHEDGKKERNNPADEVGYLELDGLLGSFARFQEGNRFNVYWSAYRRFNNSLQTINVSMTGADSDLEKMMKILNSLKFQ